jgi:hypothetical protein
MQAVINGKRRQRSTLSVRELHCVAAQAVRPALELARLLKLAIETARLSK